MLHILSHLFSAIHDKDTAIIPIVKERKLNQDIRNISRVVLLLVISEELICFRYSI